MKMKYLIITISTIFLANCATTSSEIPKSPIKEFKIEDFPTIYTNAVNIYPQVSSDAMGLALLRAGVFEDGTIVQLPDGETVRLSIK